MVTITRTANAALIDTSGFFAISSIRESLHAKAVELYLEPRAWFTHSYVAAEFVPLGEARGLDRQKVLAMAAGMLTSADLEMVWVDAELHARALELLEARLDKAYSLCDAVSFVLMRERNVTEALTTDHHFEQEGFRRLLA